MKKALLIVGVVAAALVGLIVVAGAGAQEGPGNGRVGDFVSRLADRLGISEGELTTAVKGAETDMVNDAVSQGKLTDQQGAKIIDRIQNGPMRFPRNGRHEYRPCRAQKFVIASSAEVLGMDKDELKAKLEEGKSLAEIAQEQGMTVEDFTAALTDSVKAALQAKVDAGAITQAQMDRVFEAFTSHVDQIVNFHPKPGAPGLCDGRDGPPAEGQSTPEP